MRSQIQALQQRGQQLAAQSYPCVFRFGGQDYEAASAGPDSDQALAAGGFMTEVEMTVRVGKDVMPLRPEEGDRCRVDGVDYLIAKVRGKMGFVWVIDLEGESED